MARRLILLAFMLLLLPNTSANAACRILECDIERGLFEDHCTCSQVGLTDYNGEMQSCAIRVRYIWIITQPGFPKVLISTCDCVFYNPCTSGPV